MHQRIEGWIRLLGRVTFLALASAGPIRSQATMHELGGFGGDGYAHAISSDGLVVVGRSHNGSRWRAFRWTEVTGTQDLGTLGGGGAEAFGVNVDGTIIVGISDALVGAGGLARAFRWDLGQGMLDLGLLPGGAFSRAHAVSDDGNTVVGYGTALLQGQGTGTRAFRWTPTSGMVDIGTLGGRDAIATGVSADGTWIVGGADATNGGLSRRAFRWSSGAGMQDLGTFGGPTSGAHAVSADGAVVVGAAQTPTDTRAFRWTASNGLVDLGAPAATYSEARAVSRDGAVVVGAYRFNNNLQWRAFRWTAATGFADLGTLGGPEAEALGADGTGARVAGQANDALGRPRPFLWEAQPTVAFGIGERYCTAAVANSTGWGATLTVLGSPVAATNDLRLVAQSVPTHAFGAFLVSRALGVTYPLPGSEGRLCLGGFVSRLPGQVVGSGASGVLTRVVDVTALPGPFGGSVIALPGQRWSFQAWFRDANPAPTSNFSDAVTVEFQ